MHSQLAEFIVCQSRLIGNRDRAGRNEWLGQETGHNSAARPTMPLAATMRRPQPVWVSPRMRRQRVAPRFSVGSMSIPVVSAVNTAAADLRRLNIRHLPPFHSGLRLSAKNPTLKRGATRFARSTSRQFIRFCVATLRSTVRPCHSTLMTPSLHSLHLPVPPCAGLCESVELQPPMLSQSCFARMWIRPVGVRRNCLDDLQATWNFPRSMFLYRSL